MLVSTAAKTVIADELLVGSELLAQKTREVSDQHIVCLFSVPEQEQIHMMLLRDIFLRNAKRIEPLRTRTHRENVDRSRILKGGGL